MKRLAFALASLVLLVDSTNIVLSNDDGWAEINVRIFYDLLSRAGNSVVLSAPADNKSGTGIAMAEKRSLGSCLTKGLLSRLAGPPSN